MSAMVRPESAERLHAGFRVHVLGIHGREDELLLLVVQRRLDDAALARAFGGGLLALVLDAGGGGFVANSLPPAPQALRVARPARAKMAAGMRIIMGLLFGEPYQKPRSLSAS